MSNSLDTYYKPITLFLNDLDEKFLNNKSVSVEKINVIEKKINYQTLDFKFNCKNNNKISFCISLSYNDFDSPRFTMLFKKPESEEFYEIIDEYLDPNNNGENIVETLKCILSNEFRVVYSYLNGKKIRENYIFSIFGSNGIIEINDLGYKKGILFPWDKKNVFEKIFIFEPWIPDVLDMQ